MCVWVCMVSIYSLSLCLLATSTECTAGTHWWQTIPTRIQHTHTHTTCNAHFCSGPGETFSKPLLGTWSDGSWWFCLGFCTLRDQQSTLVINKARLLCTYGQYWAKIQIGFRTPIAYCYKHGFWPLVEIHTTRTPKPIKKVNKQALQKDFSRNQGWLTGDLKSTDAGGQE